MSVNSKLDIIHMGIPVNVPNKFTNKYKFKDKLLKKKSIL